MRESISPTGQFAAVDEILSGRENLMLVARLRQLKDAGQIAGDLLARWEQATRTEHLESEVTERDRLTFLDRL